MHYLLLYQYTVHWLLLYWRIIILLFYAILLIFICCWYANMSLWFSGDSSDLRASCWNRDTNMFVVTKWDTCNTVYPAYKRFDDHTNPDRDLSTYVIKSLNMQRMTVLSSNVCLSLGLQFNLHESFFRIAIISLDLHNSFSRIVIHINCSLVLQFVTSIYTTCSFGLLFVLSDCIV